MKSKSSKTPPKKVTPQKKPPVKRSAFWADEDEDEVVTLPAAATKKQAVAAGKKILETATISKEEMIADEITPEQIVAAHLPKSVMPAPSQSYNLSTRAGGARFAIMDTLDKDWTELLCYNYELRCTMHMKRNDLQPKDSVDEVCAYLRSLR